MNTAIEHLKKVNEQKGYGTALPDLWETLQCGKKLHSETFSEHRWYDNRLYVVEVDGMTIGYCDYHITGDSSAFDMGLDPQYDTIEEMEAYETKVIAYRVK